MATTLTLPAFTSPAERQARVERLAALQQRTISQVTARLLASPSADLGQLLREAEQAPEVRRLSERARAAVLQVLAGVAANLARSRQEALSGPLSHLTPAQRAAARAGAFPYTSSDGTASGRPVRLLPPVEPPGSTVSGARTGRAPRDPRSPRRPRTSRPERGFREPRAPRPSRFPRRPRRPRTARAPRPPRPRRPERSRRREMLLWCSAPASVFAATGELGCNWTSQEGRDAQIALGHHVEETGSCDKCQGAGCRGPLAPLGNWIAQRLFGPPETARVAAEIRRRREARRARRRPVTLAARITNQAAALPPPPTTPLPAPFCATVACIVPGIGGTRCFASAAERDAWAAAEAARCQAATPAFLATGGR